MNRRHSVAILSTVACLSLALSGCGFGTTNSSPATTPATPSVAAKPTEGNSAVPSPSSLQTPAASTSSAAPTSNGAPPAPAPAPAGSQSVSCPAGGISYALPQSWTIFTKFDEAELARIAERTGVSIAEVSLSNSAVDVAGLASSRDSSGVLEQAMCAKKILSLDEAAVTQAITETAQRHGETLQKTASLDSVNGKIQYGVTYSPSKGMYGSVAYLPNSKGEMVTTRIFAGSALRIEEILGVIATTLR